MVKPCIGIKIISGVRKVRVYYGKSMWRLYVPRFGGQKDILEELMDLRQTRNLETYIQDFDVLCNRAEINEKQAMVFFIGGLEVEIKNLVKMFEPKTLKQAYNLARLQNKTLSYRRSYPTQIRHYTQTILQTTQTKPQSFQNPLKNLNPPNTPASKQLQAGLLPIPNYTYNPNSKPTKSLGTKELEDKRAKDYASGVMIGLYLVIDARTCFWCDDRFIPSHRCKNKKLYSLCIVEDEEGDEDTDEDADDEVEENKPDTITPLISINALEGTMGFHTLRVTSRRDKHLVLILIHSGSTCNFLNIELTRKLQCDLLSIKPLTVEVANGSTMSCTAMCKDFK
jgi:hypothetical protein